jgi:hypothetical protein
MGEDNTKILPNDENKAPTTEPMLEAILAKVNEGFARMEARFDTIEKDVRDIKRNQRVLNEQMLNLQGSQLDLEDRVDVLERKAS